MGVFLNVMPASGDEPPASVFGQETQSEGALMGMFYDLKQTPDRQPSESNSYTRVVQEFLIKNWDDAVFQRYYHATKPLYTTQIFVPNMNADAAPKAFGVEKTVKPSYWIIQYKGQVSPPTGGAYRFWGCADDVLAVAVNGKTVLVGCRFDTPMTDVPWKASEPDGAQAADDNLRPGDWMYLKEGEVIDLDVIIGERPGGWFNAFLMIEKEGETYEKDNRGHPILPIFQVGTYDTPVVDDLNIEPKFSKGYPPWKSYR